MRKVTKLVHYKTIGKAAYHAANYKWDLLNNILR